MNLSLTTCRCCLAKDCYKDIFNEYYFGGEKEVYCDMLLTTFNINISYQESSTKRLICEECILRLRNATEFKKRVIHVEEVFKKRLSSLKDELDDAVNLMPKEEVDDYEFSDDVINGDYIDQDIDDVKWRAGNNDEDKLSVKIEPLEEKDELPLKRITRSNVSVASKKETRKYKIKKNAASNTRKKKVSNTVNKKDIKSSAILKCKTKSDKDSQMHMNLKENSMRLILNSNICLFRSLKIKFQCFYCKQSYIHMSELREHTKIHTNKDHLYRRIKALRGMSYRNVDISSLTCKLCSDTCEDLTQLKDHLIDVHTLKFADGDHFLIPYRLDGDFKCVLCEDRFTCFLKLSNHMNSHYTNNVCEICGVSYINRLSLRIHVHTRHKEKKCTLCPATFLSTYNREKHMKNSHSKTRAPKRYCPLCDKTFTYSYQLSEHKIEKHGVERPVCVCKECGKSFMTPQNLRVHTRSVHIKERNYPCNVCEMRFFTSCDRRRHERTHDDIKSFSCSFCDGKFKAKDSLKRHVKRQHGQMYDTT